MKNYLLRLSCIPHFCLLLVLFTSNLKAQNWNALGLNINSSFFNNIHALATSGTQMYVGGTFTYSGSNDVIQFNGTSWTALGAGVNDTVYALAISGTTLYAGGSFTTAGGVPASHIAQWNGSSWSALGSGLNGRVTSLAVLGTDLYAGGMFTMAGGVTVNYVAKWNGTSWSSLTIGTRAPVYALAVIGGDLYVGGGFSHAGSVVATNIARWDGSTWYALGAGIDAMVATLAVSGTNLYAGGQFANAGGNPASSVACWNGTTWSPLGTGITGGSFYGGFVYSLICQGTSLYAGGYFTTAGGKTAPDVASWDGSSWHPMGNGMSSNTVYALTYFASNVYAGGDFTGADIGPVDCLAKWNGKNWTNPQAGINGIVDAVAVSGNNLFVGGEFSIAGDTATRYVAQWNGTKWLPLDSSMDGYVKAMVMIGTDLYIGGSFSVINGITAPGVAKWNGTSWSSVGGGGGPISALGVIGTDLYAGGNFNSIGGVTASCIAKWNGTTWSALGSGLDGSGTVYALASIGTDLYVGGGFNSAGGNFGYNNIAKWDGASWSTLGSGTDAGGQVFTLAPSGTNMYAGGAFIKAGGVPAIGIAKWDGTTWSPVGAGVDNTVSAIAISGNNVYAGGFFYHAGGKAANSIAQWDGTQWYVLDSGVAGEVHALAISNNYLYAGGNFDQAGRIVAHKIARWKICTRPQIALVSQANEKTCSPGNEGSASISVSLGATPYSYSWSPTPGAGQGTASVTQLQAGTYHVQVTASDGCLSATSTVIISPPPTRSVSFITAPSSCIPGSDGTAKATVTNGKATITYSWSPAPGTGQGTANVSGLAVGNYTLMAKDSASCIATGVTSILYNNLPVLTASISNVTCFGLHNGKIKIAISGGTAPFTYSWSGNSSISDSAIGLTPGHYTCFVKDSKGCQVNRVDSIIQPTKLSLSLTGSTVPCHNICSGNLNSTVSGGIHPYSYYWTSGYSTSNCVAVCPGHYTLTVVDSNGCSTHDTTSVLSPDPIHVTFFPRASQCGKANGFDSVSVSGGNPGYTYSWSNASLSSADTARGLTPGSYSVVVMDMSSCSDTAINTIGNTGVNISLLSTVDGNCSGAGGSATVKAQQGIPAYTYSWNPVPGGGQGTSTATGLIGNYTCIATDAAGCSSGPVAITILTSAKDTIRGTVTDSASGNIQKGWVYLYKYDTARHGHLPLMDSVAIHNGQYSFLDSVNAFILYAVADPTLYPHSVPTYNLNADQWTSANIGYASCSFADTASIKIRETLPMTGHGTISGSITQGAGYKSKRLSGINGSLSVGSPAIGINVNLEQYPGNVKAYMKTDLNGAYSFSNVLPGSYLVWVDVPGLKVSKPYIRTITTTESFLNLNYQIDSVHIYPDSLLITSTVDQVPLTTEIRLMPNPFNNEINVEFTLENSSDVGFEIYNLLGKQIAVIGKKRADTGYQHWTINSATYNLPEGVYLLKITVAGKVFSKRIIKMK